MIKMVHVEDGWTQQVKCKIGVTQRRTVGTVAYVSCCECGGVIPPFSYRRRIHEVLYRD